MNDGLDHVFQLMF